MKTYHIFLHVDNNLVSTTTESIECIKILVKKTEAVAAHYMATKLQKIFDQDLKEPFQPSFLFSNVVMSDELWPARVITVEVEYKDLEQRRWWTYECTVTYVEG